MDRMSFWKPLPLPPKTGVIAFDLLPIGKLHEVAEALLEIPHMEPMPSMPWEENVVKMMWAVDSGAFLTLAPESGFIVGQVISIPVESYICPSSFYRLYLHIFEQFGTIALDEKSQEFLTPMQYKYYVSKLANRSRRTI